jgi:sialate O-acetylesterase
MKTISIFLLIIYCTCISVAAQVRLPNFFGDNMVLQRNSPVPVWGWAKPNEAVVVQFNRQVKSIKADKTGKWMIRLDAENAGGPFELSIKGKNTIQLKNVLVGDVWLCTGQSNMEWTVGQSNNAKNEMAAADYPFIRQIKIERAVNSLPENNIRPADWKICNPASAADFSGVGYFFAKIIYDSTKIPVGLINTCWGGTNIETWISREGFESSSEFKEMIAGMPKISLDSISKLKDNGLTKRIESMQESRLQHTDVTRFKEADFDDSRWPKINLPQLWEQQSIGELDGIVWLRKTIELSADDISGNAMLVLAKIDDDDITYVNGSKVGSTRQWDALRKYSVDKGILKPGRNVIAVRVVDNGGGGGIYGDSDDLKLVLVNRTVSLAGNWGFQVESVFKTPNQNSLPSLCYNSMIAPLLPFAFKGVLWYQGESNAGRAYQYRKAFPLLITDWRRKFAQGNFPFYFVQLASYVSGGNSNEGCGWAELREAQTMTLALPNTGMAVTTDLVTDPKDIHPHNKQDVGKRLAALALNNLHAKQMVCNGPSYKSMEIKGSDIVLSFDNTGSGLHTPDKYGYVKGFEIAGADGVFYFAKATIKNHTIILSSDKVANPVAVHFGWMGDATECNLFNKEGFPALPFRTDEWKTVTKVEKYVFEKMQ